MKLYDITIVTNDGSLFEFKQATTNSPTEDSTVVVESRARDGRIIRLATITHVKEIRMIPVLENMNEVI